MYIYKGMYASSYARFFPDFANSIPNQHHDPSPPFSSLPPRAGLSEKDGGFQEETSPFHPITIPFSPATSTFLKSAFLYVDKTFGKW